MALMQRQKTGLGQHVDASLMDAATARGATTVVVDLRGVTFVDCAGVELLVGLPVAERAGLGYDIDGVVYKVDDLDGLGAHILERSRAAAASCTSKPLATAIVQRTRRCRRTRFFASLRSRRPSSASRR